VNKDQKKYLNSKVLEMGEIWEEIGIVQSIYLYPLKSAKGLKVPNVEVILLTINQLLCCEKCIASMSEHKKFLIVMNFWEHGEFFVL